MNRNAVALLFLGFSLGTPTAHCLEKGDKLPDCALMPIPSGQPIQLRQFQGKVLYVDFWASWCGPCAKSFPFFNGINKKYQDSDLKIIAINLDEEPADANEFLAKFPPQFAVASDTNQQCAQAFDVKAMPSSYLVDRTGIIRHVHLGFRSDESQALEQVLSQLLAEPKSGQ